MQLLNLNGKKIILRVDFNVPMDKDQNITDNSRIKECVATINYILDHVGTSIVLLSHLGRPLKKLTPEGNIDTKTFTLKNTVACLSELLNRPVQFCPDCIGAEADKKAKELAPGEILLMENTRFHAEEEKGDEQFAEQLTTYGDIYLNDAFGTAHRAHASTAVIAQYFPRSKKGFGFLMKRELDNAKKLLINPERPYTAIIGGAKVSDKILLLEKIIDSVDNLIIGGGMAYTLIKAQGGKIGSSLVEEERLDVARQFLEKAKGRINLYLPEDSVIADKFTAEANTQIVDSDNIPDGWMGLDIGPKAIEAFVKVISKSRSIMWNGPMGVFEMKPFAAGTVAIAKEIAEETATGAFSLIGGGDSAAAIHQIGLTSQVSFVSTGGGAMLELLEGKVLPGVKAILEG